MSLQKFRNGQNAACSPSDVIITGDLSYPATTGVDQMLLATMLHAKETRGYNCLHNETPRLINL